MANASTVTATPKKKRGRPPGSKNKKRSKASLKAAKPKGKRGRPRLDANKTKAASIKVSSTNVRGRKKSGRGVRYDENQQAEIVSFVLAQGRGGFTKAQKKYGVSYPTLARWLKESGASVKSGKAAKNAGFAPQTNSASSGNGLFSKKMIKELSKGMASLESAFAAFANALRVLE